MKAYSQDVRQRVLRVVDAGHSLAEVAKTFAVSVATIKRSLNHRRETGHVKPKAIPGRPAVKAAVLQARLLPQLEAYPDATREEHRQMFQAAYDIEASPASMTLIASLSLEGIGEALILDGAADAAAFEAYIEQMLAPSLRPGQIAILDNLSIHLGSRVKQAIEARGCRLLLLPAYSPDFSPIEEAFSKVKSVLRRAGARTREALQEAVAQALDLVTAQDARGWFLHCGHPPPVLDEKAQ